MRATSFMPITPATNTKAHTETADADARLLHPLDDDLTVHLHEEADGRLVGDTAL